MAETTSNHRVGLLMAETSGHSLWGGDRTSLERFQVSKNVNLIDGHVTAAFAADTAQKMGDAAVQPDHLRLMMRRVERIDPNVREQVRAMPAIADKGTY